VKSAKFFAVLLGAWACVGAAAAQTLNFVPLMPLPEGTRLGVLVDDRDAIPEWLTATEGSWQYTIVGNPERWRTEPTIVLEVQPRKVGLTTTKQMRLQLPLSFKATQAGETFDFPLVLFSGTGRRVRDEIDIMEPFRRYEQILLAAGLTRHFLQHLHPQDSATRRLSRRWFDAVFIAIDREDKPLRMAPFVVDVTLGAFQGDARGLAYIRSSAHYIRSLFWRDAAEFEGLLRAGDCGTAAALLAHLRSQHERFPDAAAMRGVDATAIFASYRTSHAAACP
jgi:hypothetical protein